MMKQTKTPMWDQMQVFCKHIADHQIRMVLKFDDILNEAILKHAVEIAITKNPIIFAKLIEGDKKTIWSFSKVEIDKVFIFIESIDAENTLTETLLERIDNTIEPQLFITLIRSTQSKSDTLVLNCNHAITDAAGVKDFTYQLAELYNQLSLKKTVAEAPYSPSRSLKILSDDLSFKEKMAVLKVTATNKKSAPTFSRQLDVEQLQNPGFITHTIVHDVFERIKVVGKQHGATINDVLLALFFTTFKSLYPNTNKTNRLTYTSDLRGFMAIGDYDVLSNFSAIHNIDIDNTISDFVSVLKEISRQTTIRKQKKYCLADFPLMAMLFKIMPHSKLKSVFHKEFDSIKNGLSDAAPSLTNMGIIEETLLNFDGISPLQAYMLGGVNHPNLFQIAVSTYKKQMTISFGTYLTETNKSFISNFFNELQANIEMEILSLGNINTFRSERNVVAQ